MSCQSESAYLAEFILVFVRREPEEERSLLGFETGLVTHGGFTARQGGSCPSLTPLHDCTIALRVFPSTSVTGLFKERLCYEM